MTPSLNEAAHARNTALEWGGRSKHTQAMQPTKAALLALLFACAGACALPAAPAHANSIDASREAGRDYTHIARQGERLAQRIVDEARIPGLMLVVVQDDRVLTARGFGVANTRTREPVTPDTAFRVASLSKGFAATLAALLVRDGALSWDTRISNYLTAFRLADVEGSQNLTVRDVLSHRVGLPYHALDNDLEADQPYPLLVAKLGETPIVCRPGDCYGYQNIAFSLIGDIAFAVTGDFYSRLVEKRLFHPLGMYGATFGRDALESSPSWAAPHVRGRSGWVPVRPKETYYRVPPAAGVNASARDLAQWLIAQLGHRPEVLPPDLLREVHTPQVRTPDQLGGSSWRRERLRNAHYALGWRSYDYSGHRLQFHGGAVQGYRAMMGFLPDHGLGVAVLWNSESPAPSGLFPTLIDRALGLPQRDWLQLDRHAPRRAR